MKNVLFEEINDIHMRRKGLGGEGGDTPGRGFSCQI